MTLPRRRFLHLAAGAAALPAVSRMASAQAYPSRPITLVVPFPPGGPTDLLGRMVGERLRLSFGQSVIIENVTGANGSIGVGRVVRAAPDGCGYRFPCLRRWRTIAQQDRIGREPCFAASLLQFRLPSRWCSP